LICCQVAVSIAWLKLLKELKNWFVSYNVRI
jgi:hypothetical protein